MRRSVAVGAATVLVLTFSLSERPPELPAYESPSFPASVVSPIVVDGFEMLEHPAQVAILTSELRTIRSFDLVDSEAENDLLLQLRPMAASPTVVSTRREVLATPPPPPASVGEPWFQPLLDLYFKPADHQWASRISLCESGWRVDAKNPASSASGLFQVMEYWWSGQSGYPAFDPFDAESNVKFAAWLFYHPEGGPSHWVCK